MIFVYKKWEKFCAELANRKIYGVTARNVAEQEKYGAYIVLKHDVETNVSKAYRMATIEKKYGHKGSYYVQAYLMEDVKNVELLKEMSDMGHEISYHYDVLDACKGDMDAAIQQFTQNMKLFEESGFTIKTVCQHGNPVVERVGYTSNRDFFRCERVQKLFPDISDIMVDFQVKADTNYLYFSDAGRKFNLIYDPINNDVVNSDDKNIPFQNMSVLLEYILKTEESCIISTHPHRWTSSAAEYVCKDVFFKVAKRTAKVLLHIPFMKKLMSKYYYLAKKL